MRLSWGQVGTELNDPMIVLGLCAPGEEEEGDEDAEGEADYAVAGGGAPGVCSVRIEVGQQEGCPVLTFEQEEGLEHVLLAPEARV